MIPKCPKCDEPAFDAEECDCGWFDELNQHNLYGCLKCKIVFMECDFIEELEEYCRNVKHSWD